MSCETLKDSLWLYAADEAAQEESLKVEEHLRGCPACQAEIKALKAVVSALPETPQKPPAYWDAYARAVIGRIEGEDKPVPVMAWRWAPAMILAALLATGAFYRQRQPDPQTREMIENLEFLQNLELLENPNFETELRDVR